MFIVSPLTQQHCCNNTTINIDIIKSSSKISCPNQVRIDLEFDHTIHTHENKFTSNGIMTPSSQIRAKNSKTKQDQNAQAAIYSLCLEWWSKEADLDLLSAGRRK